MSAYSYDVLLLQEKPSFGPFKIGNCTIKQIFREDDEDGDLIPLSQDDIKNIPEFCIGENESLTINVESFCVDQGRPMADGSTFIPNFYAYRGAGNRNKQQLCFTNCNIDTWIIEQ